MCHDCLYGFIGLWLLISAFVTAPIPKANWVSSIVCGAVLAGLAAWAGATYGQWMDWAVPAACAWLVFSGAVFSAYPRFNRINTLATGLMVILASFWPFVFCSSALR
jgi:hypothetical protein